jgi:hypothetical protein
MKWEFYRHAKFECPDCHEHRFVRMINENGEFYPENVGRCDRENSCTYMYHASQWLKDNPNVDQIPRTIKTKPPVKRIINGYYSFDLRLYEQLKEDAIRYNKKYQSWDSKFVCEFSNYLIDVLHFTPDFIGEVMNKYKMYEKVELYYENFQESNEVIKSRTSVVYYYISVNDDIRAIEQIYYNGFKRSKTLDNNILNKHLSNWGNFNVETTEINWCLFGEHLLKEIPDKPIIITEGVKTAFGMGLFYPEYNWLATGSSNRLVHLNFDTKQKVHFLPDAGFIKDKSYAQIWKDKVRKTYGVNFKYDIYEFNDDCSSDEIKSGCDILDLQIKEPERAKEIILNLLKQ